MPQNLIPTLSFTFGLVNVMGSRLVLNLRQLSMDADSETEDAAFVMKSGSRGGISMVFHPPEDENIRHQSSTDPVWQYHRKVNQLRNFRVSRKSPFVLPSGSGSQVLNRMFSTKSSKKGGSASGGPAGSSKMGFERDIEMWPPTDVSSRSGSTSPVQSIRSEEKNSTRGAGYR
jgi:hypothetical protein